MKIVFNDFEVNNKVGLNDLKVDVQAVSTGGESGSSAVSSVNGQVGDVKTFKGYFEYSNKYHAGDIVIFEDALLLCIEDTEGEDPFETMYEKWRPFSFNDGGSGGYVWSDTWDSSAIAIQVMTEYDYFTLPIVVNPTDSGYSAFGQSYTVANVMSDKKDPTLREEHFAYHVSFAIYPYASKIYAYKVSLSYWVKVDGAIVEYEPSYEIVSGHNGNAKFLVRG